MTLQFREKSGRRCSLAYLIHLSTLLYYDLASQPNETQKRIAFTYKSCQIEVVETQRVHQRGEFKF